jgi:hypothetical protein
VAVQTSWNPQECSTYHDLLDREERRLGEAFGGMMPDELPGAVVAVAEVWLDDAYDNITMAQACLAVRRQHEEEQVAAPEEHPEPPDGETLAEKAQCLWILRAFRQTSYVSHMAQEIGDDSTKTGWSIWSYKEYRRLLDEEMMEVCRVYAEVELADLPVSKGKEAKGWLTSAHQEAERAREHIGERIKGIKVLQALLYPATEGLSLRSQQRRARGMALRKAKGADAKPREQAEEAAVRARLQAARATGTLGRSQLAEEADTKSKETRGGQQRDPTCPRTSSGAKVDLVDSTSESDTSDPGGMPQRFRGPVGQGACPPKPPHTLPHQQGGEKVRTEVAMQEAEELPAVDTREESPGLRLPQVAGTDSSSKETGDGDAKALAPDQPPGGSDEFARELASAMSTLASLVIKASGRSVSNGGWLYFNGESEDYCTFRAKCRLFQETYHKATPSDGAGEDVQRVEPCRGRGLPHRGSRKHVGGMEEAGLDLRRPARADHGSDTRSRMDARAPGGRERGGIGCRTNQRGGTRAIADQGGDCI